MPEVSFDPADGLERIVELIRLTAAPAGAEEICQQGLLSTARALAASSGAVLLRKSPGPAPVLAARYGTGSEAEMARLGERAIETSQMVEERRAGEVSPSAVALPLPGAAELLGALVLVGPAWSPSARAFARSAARVLAASLQAARSISDSRLQGELLARRNVELETVRELAARLQELGSEEEMLQTALDLVLRKMGLESGWLFWGESSRGQLELAASRGVADGFVRQARENGIGVCLCQDVFATGRLRVARNTTDCPRLPDLVGAEGPMTHACVPLKFERGTLGVMNIANRPGQLFSSEELQFLETVGNQICLAVDKARTARAESRRNAEARALVSLARAIGGSLDRETVLAAIGDYARQLLAAERCAIFLGDGVAPAQFAYLSGLPIPGLEPGQPVDFAALGSRAFVEALRHRHTLVIQNAHEDPRANPELARRWGLAAVILVPLLAHERLEGVLMVGRSSPWAWSSDDVALASALAGQAAVAIENARLYREAQEALLRLQQAQYGMMRAERLAAVGTLASSLAHEVRNPLNSIHLQLVLLSRRTARLEEGAKPEVSALIETAQREIARLDGLVEEFLSLSSADRLKLVETDPADVVREVAALMAPAARERNVSVEEDFATPVPRIRMDREKIKQVLINLVRNAIEAMQEGGALGVSVQTTEGAVVIQVSDTGPGIEPGLDVFDLFMTTKRGGTGLGLPIARGIVEAHGGTLSYESREGRGTVFSIALKGR